MSVSNILGTVVSQSSYQRARASVANMQGGNQSIGNILSTIRQLVPGLNVSTITEPFSGSGANLGIHPEILRRAADDPEEMVRVKALAMDAYKGETAFRQGMEARGITVHAHGTIIHEDGTTSGWAIVQGPDLRERRTQFELPYDYDEDDRPSWVELMRQKLEEMLQNEENSMIERRNATDPSIHRLLNEGEFGLLSREEAENRRWAEQVNVNAQLDAILDGRDYSSLSDAQMRQLISAAEDYLNTPNRGDARRSIADRATALEQRLNEIDNDPNLSPERRNVLRRIWEEGFVSTMVRGNTRVNAESGAFASRADAEAHIQSTVNYAFGVMQNVESLSNNQNIQSLINRGMEELINRTIQSVSQMHLHSMRFARSGDDTADERRWSAAINERDNFQNSMREMVNTLREQMVNRTRIFQLPPPMHMAQSFNVLA